MPIVNGFTRTLHDDLGMTQAVERLAQGEWLPGQQTPPALPSPECRKLPLLETLVRRTILAAAQEKA